MNSTSSTTTPTQPSKRPTAPLYIPPSLRTSSPSIRCDKPDHQESILERLNNLRLDGRDDAVESDQFGILVRPAQRDTNALVSKIATNNNLNTKSDPSLDYTSLTHIIELYDFPASLETMVVESELKDFKESGFALKWVDDTHCLVVFSTQKTAEAALQRISNVLVKGRPVSEASLASKWKIARSPGDWARPYKQRPPCDTSVASRLISSHLGLPRPKPTPEALQARQAARERKIRKKHNQKAMWSDDDDA